MTKEGGEQRSTAPPGWNSGCCYRGEMLVVRERGGSRWRLEWRVES